MRCSTSPASWTRLNASRPPPRSTPSSTPRATSPPRPRGRAGRPGSRAGLLPAPSPPAGEGAGLRQALGVLGGATGAAAMVLSLPSFDANEWTPAVASGVEAQGVGRPIVRELVGDRPESRELLGSAANEAREKLRVAGSPPALLTLVALRI